ncbi:hypothetical protein ABEX93_25890, partial [Bacillus tropicus]
FYCTTSFIHYLRVELQSVQYSLQEIYYLLIDCVLPLFFLQNRIFALNFIVSKSFLLCSPKVEITPTFINAYDIWKTGTIIAVEAMKKANVPETTFYRMVQKYEAQLAK